MKFIIALLSLAVIGVLGYFGYNYYLSVRQPVTTTSANTSPTSFQNPFDDKKPTTSFGGANAPTPTPVNPFAEPTQGYQNPFSASPAGSQEYQNPFEALR